MKNFLLGGTIVDDESQAWAFEDVTPSQVRAALTKLEPNEPITFEISSPGGSVTAGVAIANLIRQASADGHETTAHVIGIAASMASVITCACDKINIDESAFMMIHNPWTVTQGDAEDLRKSADVLDQMKAAIMSFYLRKFKKCEADIAALMDAETWFTGAEAETFGFDANVIATGDALKVAACARSLPGFAKAPEAAVKLFVLGRHEETLEEKVEAAVQIRIAAAMKSRDTEINELKARVVELNRTGIDNLARAEADYLAKLNARENELTQEFNSKLDVIGKELTEAKAEVISLNGQLESVKGELQATASALEDRTHALAVLNASVNAPASPVVEKTYDEIVGDSKASPAEKLAAAKKEIARRRKINR